MASRIELLANHSMFRNCDQAVDHLPRRRAVIEELALRLSARVLRRRSSLP